MLKPKLAMAAALATTTILAGLGTAAEAQQPRRAQTVTERSRPAFDAQGVRLGSFLLLPQVSLSAEYDDNIFATQEDTESDTVFILRPEARLRSDWGRHALGLRAGGAFGRFVDNDSEDFDDYYALADGRLDILTGTAATGRLGYQHLHEDRGAPNEAGGAEPTEYDLTTAGLTLSRDVARLVARVSADWRNLDFEDVAAVGGGEIDQDARDRDEYGLVARLGYATSPNFTAFVQGGYNWRKYEQSGARDSDGYAITGGVALDLGGITTAEAFAGYRRQSYEDPTLSSNGGFTFGATVNWNPTPLTSVEVGIVNRVEETTVAGSSGFTDTEYRVSVDHELLRNLILGGYASYATNDYEDIVRDEDLYSAGLGVKYLFNRTFNVDVGYGFSSRVSNVPGRDFERNSIFLRLTAAL